LRQQKGENCPNTEVAETAEQVRVFTPERKEFFLIQNDPESIIFPLLQEK